MRNIKDQIDYVILLTIRTYSYDNNTKLMNSSLEAHTQKTNKITDFIHVQMPTCIVIYFVQLVVVFKSLLQQDYDNEYLQKQLTKI